MGFDLDNTLDTIKEETIEVAELAHEKTSEFHENYVSKVLPDCGKYGDAAKFVAEMLPGVSEYNAIRDGDWQAFAIAAGIDLAAVALGAYTAGTGYAAVKGGSTAATTGVKVAVKEIAEAGAEKAVKEVAEAATEKLVKEAVEAGAEKIVKEAVEAGTEKIVKEAVEAGTEKVVKEVAEAGTEKAVKEVAEAGIDTIEKKVLEIGEKIDKTKFSEYIDEIEKITQREISPQQKELIEEALKNNDYAKLSKEARDLAVKEFRGVKDVIIKEWEEMTGQVWPRYIDDVVNENEVVIRTAGQRFDAHHIIELCTGGPNEWWNIHPAAFPGEHQNGIHAVESIASKIFGN